MADSDKSSVASLFQDLRNRARSIDVRQAGSVSPRDKVKTAYHVPDAQLAMYRATPTLFELAEGDGSGDPDPSSLPLLKVALQQITEGDGSGDGADVLVPLLESVIQKYEGDGSGEPDDSLAPWLRNVKSPFQLRFEAYRDQELSRMEREKTEGDEAGEPDESSEMLYRQLTEGVGTGDPQDEPDYVEDPMLVLIKIKMDRKIRELTPLMKQALEVLRQAEKMGDEGYSIDEPSS